MDCLKSNQIVYSEHHYDECFEYKDGGGRVPEGNAVGYEVDHPNGYDDQPCVKLILFDVFLLKFIMSLYLISNLSILNLR